ncbi:MAG: c-type cytochrome [Roseobacter sp.]
MKSVILGLAVVCCAGTAIAQDLEAGEQLYQLHCASCHGLEADGTGPMAPVLLLQPTDLTLLKAENDGVFPRVRVVMRIDGRDPLISHGSPMPVYGYFFEGDDQAMKAETGQPIMTSRAIVDLVGYLESLQQ